MAIPRFRTHFGSSTWTLAVSLLAILLLSMGSPRFATASFGCGAYMLCNDTECPDEEEAKTALHLSWWVGEHLSLNHGTADGRWQWWGGRAAAATV